MGEKTGERGDRTVRRAVLLEGCHAVNIHSSYRERGVEEYLSISASSLCSCFALSIRICSSKSLAALIEICFSISDSPTTSYSREVSKREKGREERGEREEEEVLTVLR